MYATVQPGGCSPNPVNLSQLKTGSDRMQTPASFSSQGKGKKRKRSDHGLATVKREHHVKREDSDLGQVISENSHKSSISNITKNGRLVDVEGVKKLMLLMQTDRKLELNSRSMLAAVVAATDRYDCLSQFVLLKGLSVLDEWLQDINNGKMGGDDKPVQEFIVVLLRALDKLPVNLQALQLCNIGKSVNRLRTYKNLEIQKKARSLVDTWKKRVEAEMNVIDATKSGSHQAVPWTSTRSRLPEVSLDGNRQTRSSSVTMVTASKTPVKSVHVELAINSTSPTGTVKSAMSPASAKDRLSRLAFRSPSNAVREDRSSSSSQSHNNSQSCSKDHTKTMVSTAKEDARSSTAGSMSVGDQTSIDSSCHRRRSINGYAGTGPAECHRKVETSRSSRLHKSPAPEKDSIEGNSHKIIVKIPNKGYHHPADSILGDAGDNPSLVINRSVSPLKHDHSDPNVNNIPVASDVNAESWQSNDLKDMLSASEEADGSPEAMREEQSSRDTEVAAKFLEVSNFASSSLTSGHKAVKVHESSFNSINALIESVKYSEGDISPSDEDEAGMNLLASVAAGEVLAMYDGITSNDSPQRSVPLKVDSIMGYEAKMKSSNDNNAGDDCNQSVDDAREDVERPDDCPDDCLPTRDALCYVGLQLSDKLLQNRINNFPKFEPATRGLGKENRIQQVEQCPGNDGRRPDELVMGLLAKTTSSVSPLQRLLNIDESKNLKENVSVATGLMVNGIQNSSPLARCALLNDDNKVNIVSCTKVEKKTIVGPLLKQLSDHNMMKTVAADQRSGMIDEINKIKGSSNQTEMQKYDQVAEVVSSNVFSSFDNRAIIIGNLESADENKENVIQYVVNNKEESGSVSMRGVELRVKPKGSKKPQVKGEKTEECNSNFKDTSATAAARASGSELKVKFDLNEGFIGDESKYVKSISLTAARATVHSINSLPFSASITVAAAAKGPFVYPDDLMKSKGEPGWKGSAATSAFRPAEPRKALEMSLSSSNVVLDSNNTGKHSWRPVLDFDLNVPDEGILEDAEKDEPISSVSVRSSGGLDLDLNEANEATEMIGQYLVRSGHRMETSFMAAKPSSSGGFSNCDVRRIDFDLNDGPSFDETNTEPPLSNQHVRIGSKQSQPLVAVHRLNNDVDNFSSLFPPGNTYSSVTIPSTFHDGVEQTFPLGTPPRMILGSSTGGTPSLNPDVYWGSVLSSSPAVSFPSSFQYPVFHFGTSFPLPPASFSGGSAAATFMDSSGGRLCFPTVNSQLLGPAVASAPSQYPRPYFVSIQDSRSNSSVEISRRWGRQNLDLNAGPGALEMIEGKDEASPLAARQLSLSSSQLLAEEQLRMYHHQVAPSNAMKRKDPDCGWDNEGFQFKQASWQ